MRVLACACVSVFVLVYWARLLCPCVFPGVGVLAHELVVGGRHQHVEEETVFLVLVGGVALAGAAGAGLQVPPCHTFSFFLFPLLTSLPLICRPSAFFLPSSPLPLLLFPGSLCILHVL